MFRRPEVNRTSLRRAALPTVAALALGMGLSACGAGNESSSSGDSSNAAASSGPKLTGTLNGAGSSAQEAAQAAWQSGFQQAHNGVTVNYDPVGSGGGREQFLAGGVLFAGSDSYLDDDELTKSKKTCGGVEAFDSPAYVSPIALVYNVDGVKDLQLSGETIAGIFAGKITKWNDKAIAADNPDAKLPSTTITPVHRSDDSGTQDNFTQYLSAIAPKAWTSEPDGVWPLKSGEGANGTSGVIESVTNGAGSIGFADESQAGDLSVAKVKVGTKYVAPSAQTAAKVVDVSPRAKGRPAGDIAIDVDRTTTEAGAYPVVLVSYVIACPSYPDKAKADLVKGYLTYVVSPEGQQAAAKAAGSSPLSSKLSSEASKQVAAITTKS
jgi:phosphate transport system substrate-binding protein